MNRKQCDPIKAELCKVTKEENKMQRAYVERNTLTEMEIKIKNKIPPKILAGLQKAFHKAFSLLFVKGSDWIEKTYNRDSLEKEFQINNYAITEVGRTKDVARLVGDATGGNAITTAVTAIEGIGLGALGIGLPDIGVWLSVLLRSIYTTALKYGFNYDNPQEKLFILKLMEASLLSGEEWKKANAEVDTMLTDVLDLPVNDEILNQQIEKTSNAFAVNMLVTKFIQGFPIVGMIGGATNPLYYHKIMRYVQLKYKKRYLLPKVKRGDC